MVSVFEGQLTRTWFYKFNNRNHVINLYHDTITGVRSAMLDFQEIRASMGSSSLMMESKGHRIFFTVEDLPGYIEIKRSGWTGFAYSCVINDKLISEATSEVQADQSEVFRPKILETTLTADENSEHSIVWYVLRTTRIKDNTTTTVHRRFRDFVELNSQVKQNLKGNGLRWALPPIPEKPLKSLTDHRDPAFIQDRAAKLEIFIAALVAVPHVSEMICVKAFVGIMEQVREFSLSFHVPTIGMSLLPSERLGDNTPAIVGLIQKPDICSGVMPGDSISKINGVAVAGTNFNGVISRIKSLPRPLIIHFIQVIGATPQDFSPGTSAKSHNNSNSNNSPKNSASPVPSEEVHSTGRSKPLPTFEGDLYEDVAPAATISSPAPKSSGSGGAQTWTTYDEAEEETTARDSTDFTDVIVENLQTTRINSSPTPSAQANNSPAKPVTPPPAPAPEPSVLKKPLPLGWD